MSFCCGMWHVGCVVRHVYYSELWEPRVVAVGVVGV